MQKTAGKGVTRDLPPPLHACKINGPLCLRLCYSAPRGKKESRSARFRLAFFSFYIFFFFERTRALQLSIAMLTVLENQHTLAYIVFFFFTGTHPRALVSRIFPIYAPRALVGPCKLPDRTGRYAHRGCARVF